MNIRLLTSSPLLSSGMAKRVRFSERYKSNTIGHLEKFIFFFAASQAMPVVFNMSVSYVSFFPALQTSSAIVQLKVQLRFIGRIAPGKSGN